MQFFVSWTSGPHDVRKITFLLARKKIVTMSPINFKSQTFIWLNLQELSFPSKANILRKPRHQNKSWIFQGYSVLNTVPVSVFSQKFSIWCDEEMILWMLSYFEVLAMR